jgi:hypothetical protein
MVGTMRILHPGLVSFRGLKREPTDEAGVGEARYTWVTMPLAKKRLRALSPNRRLGLKVPA